MKKYQDFKPGEKPAKLCELANYYGVDRRTLRKWMAPFEHKIGHRKGQFYSPWQVRQIIYYLDDQDR